MIMMTGARYVSPEVGRALFDVRGSSGVNLGALCSTVAAGVRFQRSLLPERVRSGSKSGSTD